MVPSETLKLSMEVSDTLKDSMELSDSCSWDIHLDFLIVETFDGAF